MAGRARMRRRWSHEEKRRIVAQTLIPGVSVSQVARRYEVNTNLVFTWRRDPRLRPRWSRNRRLRFFQLRWCRVRYPIRARRTRPSMSRCAMVIG